MTFVLVMMMVVIDNDRYDDDGEDGDGGDGDDGYDGDDVDGDDGHPMIAWLSEVQDDRRDGPTLPCGKSKHPCWHLV